MRNARRRPADPPERLVLGDQIVVLFTAVSALPAGDPRTFLAHCKGFKEAAFPKVSGGYLVERRPLETPG